MNKINIKININKDAWNWWDACNKVSYDVNWSERVTGAIKGKIIGQGKKQALSVLSPYLQRLYKKEDMVVKAVEVSKVFAAVSAEIFRRMEKVTGRKIYRDSFTMFLTTFPRAAYDFSKGYVWLPVVWPEETYIRTFLHELLHFQTYAYWSKYQKEVGNERFEDAKEALTVILNEEFSDIMVWPDKGYAKHKSLREKILMAWKKKKSFSELIKYSMSLVRE